MPLEGDLGNTIKIGKKKLSLPKNWHYIDRNSGTLWISKFDPKTKEEIGGYKSAEGFKGDIISGCGEKRCSSILTPNGVTKDWSTFDWWARITCIGHGQESFDSAPNNMKLQHKKERGIKTYNSCLKDYGIKELDNPSEMFFGTFGQLKKNHSKIIEYINS